MWPLPGCRGAILQWILTENLHLLLIPHTCHVQLKITQYVLKTTVIGNSIGYCCSCSGCVILGGQRRGKQEFRFRFRQCRYRNFWQEKAREFVIFLIYFREDIFPVYYYSESESNSLKSIQRFTNFPVFFLPEVPIPALPEPESKFLVPVPLAP